MKQKIISLIFIATMIVLPVTVTLAAPPPTTPPCAPNNPPPGPPIDDKPIGYTPLGGGLLILLSLGGLYGAKKVYSSRRKLNE